MPAGMMMQQHGGMMPQQGMMAAQPEMAMGMPGTATQYNFNFD